ncbi:MAG: 7TM-DISM domain-containing protein [Gammaproteobacteria bacterium]|nr:7TM-DISM domain-containing protein [Gammaproteobacteria bacterium]MDP6732727.1 7TM-DISM domain-containing protein [Gammaproteobacteria bacterium]
MYYTWLLLNTSASLNRSYQLALVLVAALLISGGVSSAELNISQNQLPVALGLYLDHFEDVSTELTLEDIMAPDIQWQRSTQVIPTFGLSESAHWFSIVISVDEALNEKLVLSMDSPGLDRIDFYFVQPEEVVVHKVAGDTIAVSELDQPYRFPVVAYEIATANQQTRLFFRTYSQSGVEIPLTLTTMSDLARNQ